MNKTKIESLQVARALAAVMVASGHTINVAEKRFANADYGWMDYLYSIGGSGVDIFFIISGFIMVYTSRNMEASPQSVGLFWARRLARIVPLYWLITTITLGVLLLGLSTDQVSMSATFIAKSYLFLPVLNTAGDLRPVVGVGWTLIYEMFFYLWFGLSLLMATRWRLPFLTAALGMLVVLGILMPSTRQENVVLVTYTDALLLEFLLGAWIARFYFAMEGRGSVWLAATVLAAGWVALSYCARFRPDENYGMVRFLAAGLPSALIVCGLLMLERAMGGWDRIPFLSAAGDSSYSLYLTHKLQLLGVGLMTKLFMDLRQIDAAHFYLLMLACELFVAYLVFRHFERPVTEKLNAWLAQRKTDRFPAPAGHHSSTP